MSAGCVLSTDVCQLLQELVTQCDTCQKYKWTPPKPSVCLPLASDFNDTVTVDLHELEHGTWYLHIIDIFTRFSAGCIMKTKRASEFVTKFLKCWISVHGCPTKLFSDNGGEFDNEEVRVMAEKFNIEVKTTPAYSPWSNGVLDRHNRTLTEILLQVKSENKCTWEDALNWALMAKNALTNIHGFSSYQLVCGRNPKIPSIFHDRLPALEDIPHNATVASHLNAMYSAQKAFTEAE